MFNLGFSELLLLGVIALVFIGPNQLPEVARTIGRLLNEWKRATSDFQSTITTHLTEEVQQRRIETAESAHTELMQTEDDYAKHIAAPGAQHHESGAGTIDPPVNEEVSPDPILPTTPRKDS